MSTEMIQFADPNLVDRETGEFLDIDNVEQMQLVARDHPEILAAYIAHLDDTKRNIDLIRVEAGRYLVERMDADATQTLRVEGHTVTINGGSDEIVEYDATLLHSALSGLVAEGVLSEAGCAKALRVKYEVSKSGINSLQALRDDRVDAAITHAETIKTRPRRVTIK
jgi:hypothetical protein